MKIIVIGAVAAGTSAAVQAKRTDPSSQVSVYEKESFISYSGCGLPYFISGVIPSLEDITPRDQTFFKEKYDVDIKTLHKVIFIDKDTRTVTVKDLENQRIFDDTYDRLIIATGAKNIIPPIQGSDSPHVFTLKSPADALNIKNFLKEKAPKNALIVGSGFIGLEMAENLTKMGLCVTIAERADRIFPLLSAGISSLIEKKLTENSIKFFTSNGAKQIEKGQTILSNGEKVESDIVLIAAGIKPNVALADIIGLKKGKSGAISVNSKMESSEKNIYACGDCCEIHSIIDQSCIYRPLGSTANKMGTIAGLNAAGEFYEFPGIAGTSIFRVCDLTVASTGFNAKTAREHGFDAMTVQDVKYDRYPFFEGHEMLMELTAEKTTGRILGGAVCGESGADKRIDILASLISKKGTVKELMDLDLAYSPPYSTSRDALVYPARKLYENQNQ